MKSILTTAHESFQRILSGMGREFFGKFYESFLTASPEVAEKFAGTDMDAQKDVLRKSFYYMLNYFSSRNPEPELTKIAMRHRKSELDIAPHLYDLWTEKLIGTIAETDPEFDEEVEDAWRQIVQPVVAYMKAVYSANS